MRSFTFYTRSLLIVSTLLCVQPAIAHDSEHTASEEAGDFVSITDHGLTLTLKLVPAAALSDAPEQTGTATAAHAAALRYAVAHASDQKLTARVGDPAYLVASLSQNGRPVSGANFELVFDHIEDDKRVFETSSGPTDGTWIWGQQFFDGAEHRVHLSAQSDANAEGTSAEGPKIAAELVVRVEAISPPGSTIFRTILLLLAVVAGAMFLGYVLPVGRRNL